MQFELSEFYKNNNSYKLELPFGTFYFCEKFYVSEINEGEHLNYERLERIMHELIDFYGKDVKLGFIANRKNSYSIDPQIYGQIDKKYKIVLASAIVVYTDFSFVSSSLEKKFTSTKIKRCMSLKEAIAWILNLRELN